jgi:hypothetical protein
MPEKVTMLENKLRAKGRAKGLNGERLDAYIYGTMTRMGWKKGKPMKDVPEMK